MKKYLALGLLSSLLLTSCSMDWNDANVKKIGELEKQVTEMKKEKEDDLFKKKEGCAKYSNEMLNFAKKFRSEVYELNEIFYSPKLNSCLFIGDTGEQELLFDYFSKQNLDIHEVSNLGEWDSKIKELKGE